MAQAPTPSCQLGPAHPPHRRGSGSHPQFCQVNDGLRSGRLAVIFARGSDSPLAPWAKVWATICSPRALRTGPLRGGYGLQSLALRQGTLKGPSAANGVIGKDVCDESAFRATVILRSAPARSMSMACMRSAMSDRCDTACDGLHRQLAALTDVIDAYEYQRWPKGKIPGDQG